jgi:ABC-type dipeptide/oligopeptide/nickel transport system permease subunit
MQIILHHIIHNLIQHRLSSAFAMASAIIAEASLSFLGVGVPPEIPTWGTMLADSHLHQHRLEAATLSRPVYFYHGARHQPYGRWAARHSRSST